MAFTISWFIGYGFKRPGITPGHMIKYQLK